MEKETKFLTVLIFLLLFVGFVSAGVDPKVKCNPNIDIPWIYDPIGCECTNDVNNEDIQVLHNRDSAGNDREYCFIGSDGFDDGIGKIVHCSDVDYEDGGDPNPEEIPECGNGIQEYGEECDDSNTLNGDGCSSSCQNEDVRECNPATSGSLCSSDGDCSEGEVCRTELSTPVCMRTIVCGEDNFCLSAEDGYCGLPKHQRCNKVGEVDRDCGYCAGVSCNVLCGDGTQNSGEQCDDGNVIDGDGCSSTCRVETTSGGSATPEGGNSECGASRPYCSNDRCHECLEDSQCIGSIGEGKCISGQYNHKINTCSYCETIKKGRSIFNKETIIFYVQEDSSLDNQDLIDRLTSIEPFNFFYDNGNFDVKVVRSSRENFRYLFPHYNGGDFNQYGFDTLQGETSVKIREFLLNSCGENPRSNDVVTFYIDSTIDKSAAYTRVINGEIIASIFSSPSDARTITHELAHGICKLADEYDTERHTNNKQINAINLDFDNSQGREICPKFAQWLPIDNCFTIGDLLGRASTEKSLLDSDIKEKRLNAISCAGCLNEVMGSDIASGIEFCYNNFQGKIVEI